MIPSLLGGGLALALLVFLLFRAKSGTARGRGAASMPGSGAGTGRQANPASGPRAGSCPLCDSVLGPGERIKSDITPGKGERMMRIFGCPHCLSGEESRPARHCPVCGRGIEAGGFAVARYFERPGRRHVHVLGCTGCRVSRREKVSGR